MTHDTGWNTINEVNVTYFFGYQRGLVGVGCWCILSMFATSKQQKTMLEAKKRRNFDAEV